MKRVLCWTAFALLLALATAGSASASCSVTVNCSCGTSLTCSGNNTCSAGADSVTCDGQTKQCPIPCSMTCPTDSSRSCSGCYCYYWEDYFYGTSAIMCSQTQVSGFPGTGALGCGNGTHEW
ncbi:MAG TPA: hypothetical protein VG477_01095 [Thermoanaerobaculia bacterium]|nr:hypothetical protein [Thermoanaerobaculia bacterium]